MTKERTPLNERQRKTIASAIRLELDLQRVSHEEAAQRLNLSLGAFRNKISNAEFSPQVAMKWSRTLGIPYDTFFFTNNVSTLEDKMNNLSEELNEMREELRTIKKVMRSMYSLVALLEPEETNEKEQ